MIHTHAIDLWHIPSHSSLPEPQGSLLTNRPASRILPLSDSDVAPNPTQHPPHLHIANHINTNNNLRLLLLLNLSSHTIYNKESATIASLSSSRLHTLVASWDPSSLATRCK